MTEIATSTGVRAGHVVVPMAAPVPAAARLSFDNGIERTDIRAGENPEHLLEARFKEPHPVVWAADDNIHVDYPLGSRLLRRVGPNAVRLNPAVAWSLDVHGGAAHLDLDLTGLPVRSVACHAGVAHLQVLLGRPTGEVVIRLTSLKAVRIERPAEVPVRLEMSRAATKVRLDDRWFGAIAGGLTDETAGFRDAGARYRVVVTDNADDLTITSIQ